MSEADNHTTDPPSPVEPEDTTGDPQLNVQIGHAILPVVSAIMPPYLAKPHIALNKNPQETFQVWLNIQSLITIVAHTATTPLEAGGIVVGQTYFWENCYHIQIEAAIPATQAESEWTGLRFTVEAWKETLAIKDRHFPDRVVVGWYHSHPLMSIGMSDWDISLHEGFFREPWQLSLITDPYLGILGLFHTERSFPKQITALSISELIAEIDHQPVTIGHYKAYILYTPRPHPIYGLISINHFQSRLLNFREQEEVE